MVDGMGIPMVEGLVCAEDVVWDASGLEGNPKVSVVNARGRGCEIKKNGNTVV